MLVARSRVLLKGKAKVSCVGRGEHIYIYVCLHLPPKRRPTGVYRIIYVQVGAVCINYHAVSWQKPSEWASAPLHKNFTPKVNVRRALCFDGGRRERFVAYIYLECAPRMHWMEANPNRTKCGKCSGEGRLIYDLERSSKFRSERPMLNPELRRGKWIICLIEPQNDKVDIFFIFLDLDTYVEKRSWNLCTAHASV